MKSASAGTLYLEEKYHCVDIHYKVSSSICGEGAKIFFWCH